MFVPFYAANMFPFNLGFFNRSMSPLLTVADLRHRADGQDEARRLPERTCGRHGAKVRVRTEAEFPLAPLGRRGDKRSQIEAPNL